MFYTRTPPINCNMSFHLANKPSLERSQFSRRLLCFQCLQKSCKNSEDALSNPIRRASHLWVRRSRASVFNREKK